MCFSPKKKQKKKKKKNDLFFPLHCDGELTQGLFEMMSVSRRTIDSRSDQTSQSLWADKCPSRRVADGEEAKGRLLANPTAQPLTVAYFDPLSDE